VSAAKYALLTWYAISALIGVSRIGKPSKPTTPGVGAISLVIIGIMATLVVIA
jgi:hypothetical protein